MTNTTNKPEKVIRIGSVSASVWKRSGKEGSVFYTVQFQRSYRTDDKTQSPTASITTTCSTSPRSPGVPSDGSPPSSPSAAGDEARR